jgi:hypothetical protein
VTPPDGTANLALVEPKPDRPEYKLIGGYGWVLFMAEDVHAKSPPQRMLLGSARGADLLPFADRLLWFCSALSSLPGQR